MYKVYIENSAIVFAQGAPTGEGADTLYVPSDGQIAMTKLLQKLQFTKKLTILSDDPGRVFDRFRSSMPFIEAGGGLVADGADRLLMIFRNGRWDLPKGKLEPGERIEECAVREVSEECSLEEEKLVRGEPITRTFHGYRIRGEWVLKRTTWFHMRYEGDAQPRPQTVEGITRAEWIPRAEVPALLRNTYYTIADVFREAGFAL